MFSSFQLCVSVQISPESGGIGGKVLYIDTESSFRPERVLHVAKAMRYASKAQGLPFDDRSLLDNITVLQIREANQMSAFIQYHLHSFLCQHKTVIQSEQQFC